MSKTEKLNEEQVFKQEVSDDELEAVAGGREKRFVDEFVPDCIITDDDRSNCYNTFQRNIYAGGFPNCAATVEQASWCDTNDACFKTAVEYLGRKSCGRAWK